MEKVYIDKTTLAIMGIIVLGSVALVKEIDGTLLIPVCSILAGLGGYEYHKKKAT